MRKTINLNQNWKFAKTDAVPSVFPEEWKDITLPHTWNANDGMDGGNDYYRGKGMYVRKLRNDNAEETILSMDGAVNSADVFLNGIRISHHDGGFSTFRLDLTPYLQEENLLAIRVDNADNNHVYPQEADFAFYGSLYRDVSLMEVNRSHFELTKNGTSGISIVTELKDGIAYVHVTAEVTQGDTVSFTTNGQTVRATVIDHKANGIFILDKPHLCDELNDPFLYELKADLIEKNEITDSITTHYGIRTMEVDKEKGFILNGKPYPPLHGVSRNQDRIGKGNAISKEDMEEDIQTILDVGANTVHLAHYQHNQYFYDLCDKYGLIVWAEIPYITKHMDNGDENTKSSTNSPISWIQPDLLSWHMFSYWKLIHL